MRTDKDEIARLKAENLGLQKKLFAEKPAPVANIAKSAQLDAVKLKKDLDDCESKLKKQIRDNEELMATNGALNEKVSELIEEVRGEKSKIERMKEAHADEINRSSFDLLAANKEIGVLAEKIECINMLKIKNSELEGQISALHNRAVIAEANVR